MTTWLMPVAGWGGTLPCDLSFDVFDITYPLPNRTPPSSILNSRGQTDFCENITLSKLRLQAVKMSVTVTVAINW